MSAAGGMTLGRDSSGTDTDDASDWSESPNSATQPNGLAFADHTFFDTGDVDYLGLTLTKDQRYSVRTFSLFGAADTFIELLAEDGATVLASRDDRGPLLPESDLTFRQNSALSDWLAERQSAPDVQIERMLEPSQIPPDPLQTLGGF